VSAKEANPPQDDRHSFVVRIWREAADGQAGTVAWRGTVDHVGSGARLYFYDLEAIARFVREQVGLHKQHPHHWWTGLLGWFRREST